MVLVISASHSAPRQLRHKYGYEIDPNQSLIALGVANTGSGCLAGLAGAAACRSQRSTMARARCSEVSPLVAAVLIVVTLLLADATVQDLRGGTSPR